MKRTPTRMIKKFTWWWSLNRKLSCWTVSLLNSFLSWRPPKLSIFSWPSFTHNRSGPVPLHKWSAWPAADRCSLARHGWEASRCLFIMSDNSTFYVLSSKGIQIWKNLAWARMMCYTNFKSLNNLYQISNSVATLVCKIKTLLKKQVLKLDIFNIFNILTWISKVEHLLT